MTDIATLALRIDATQAGEGARELDKLTGAGSRAETQTKKLSASTEIAERRWRQSTLILAEMKREQDAAALAAQKLAQAQQSVVASGQRVAASTGAQRAGMQQLSMQIGDMATMFSLGARPMQVFASQSGQVIQAISLMSGGASKFSAFMMGPWGMALTAATLVMVPLIGSLFDTEEGADGANRAIKDLAQQFDFAAMSAEQLREVNELLAESNAKVERTALGAATATRNMAQRNIEAAQTAIELAKAQLEGLKVALLDPKMSGIEGFNQAAANKAGGLEEKIAATSKSLEGFKIQARGAQYEVDTLTAGMSKQELHAERLRSAVLAMGRAYKLTGDKSFYEQGLAFQAQLTALENQRSDKRAGSTSARVSDEAKAYERAAKAAQDYILNLEFEISKAGKSASEIRKLEVARAADAAATDEQRAKIIELGNAREAALAAATANEYVADLERQKNAFGKTALELQRMAVAAAAAAAPTTELTLAIIKAGNELEAAQIGKAADDFDKMLGKLQDENRLLGLVGPEREKAALALEEHALKAQWTAQGLTDIEDLWQRYLAIRLEGVNKQTAIDDDLKVLARANEELEKMIQHLSQIGGLGNALSGLLRGLQTGDFSGLGAAGVLFDELRMSKSEREKQTKILTDGIEKIFGTGGEFSKAMATALQGAGIGMTAGSLVAGRTNSLEEQIGSAVGGAIGSAFGPIGSAIGGLIGSLAGGLFNGPAKGSATLNGLGITGTMGKGDQLSAANESANAILDTLNRLADALGGTLGSVAGVSIGMRGDEWRVDPSGSGQTKAPGVINFGQDGEAAVSYAIKLLIERGVIDGIRASTQNILKAGGDLEEALNKALMWESAFKELEAAASPFAAQMKELSAYFDELNEIGKQYGATVEELGKIQELQQLKVAQLIAQASASYRSTFYTDAENVAYAKQTISSTLTPMGYGSVDTVAEYKALVEATDALANPELYGALMDLADEFGVLKDAADSAAAAQAAEQAKKDAIAAQRGQMEVALLRAQGREIEAVAKARQLELEALDPSLRGLQQEINKAQDIAAARDDLRDAYERESAALQKVVQDTEKAVTTWRAFSDSLAGAGGASVANTQSLLIKFMEAAGNADVNDPSKLTGAGSAYLDALRNTATSYTEYQRGVGTVRSMVGSAIDQAASQGSQAQQQLDAMKETVGQLIDLNETLMSVDEGIAKLNALMGGGSTTGGTGGGGGTSLGDRLDNVRDQLAGVFDIFRDRFDRQERLNTNMLSELQGMRSFFKGITRDGSAIIVQTDNDTPLAVSG